MRLALKKKERKNTCKEKKENTNKLSINIISVGSQVPIMFYCFGKQKGLNLDRCCLEMFIWAMREKYTNIILNQKDSALMNGSKHAFNSIWVTHNNFYLLKHFSDAKTKVFPIRSHSF